MKYKSKHLLRMAIGLAGYVLGLLALNYFDNDQSRYRYWLVLLPLLPLIYMATAVIRGVCEMDEMQRKIHMEALAFSGIATGFTCFTYLFLREMGAPEFHGEWAFYIMWAYYGLGRFFSWRRYR